MNSTTLHEMFQEARSDPSLHSTLNIRELLETDTQILTKDDNIPTLQIIAQNIFNGLDSLNLDAGTMADYCTRLADYKIIEEFHELIIGRYIRWIRRIQLDSEPINTLNRGGVLVNIFFKDDGVILQMKPCNTPFSIKLKYDNFVLFQKRTADEQIMLMSQHLLP